MASGPESLRISSIFAETSFIACSQERRCHLPLTSFIGVLSRCECSTMPCSRIDAPLAQCAPRFSGDSNTGSCRVHTPFSTVASIAQPTEQCVQTVRFFWTDLASLSAAAVAGPMAPYGNWLANAPAPAARPDRLRNVRRSIVDILPPACLFNRGPVVGALSDFGRVVVEHVFGFAITLRGFGVCRSFGRHDRTGERFCRDGRGARATRTECEQEAAALRIGGFGGVRGDRRLRCALR